MNMSTINIDISPYAYNPPYPEWVDYLFLTLLFLGIILFIIGIWIFAKWLTTGPKFKRTWAKITGKNKGEKHTDGVIVKKGEIYVEEGYIESIDEDIRRAKTPQELLEAQLRKEKHEQEYVGAKEKIREDEENKLAKIEAKEEKKQARQDAKDLRKELKEKEKLKKEEIRNQKSNKEK